MAKAIRIRQERALRFAKVEDPKPNPKREQRKKRYEPPRLVELGPVQELTRGMGAETEATTGGAST